MATNGILVFCPDGTEQGGDILSQAAYASDSQRQRGNQPGIARRELVNKAMKQATVMASALAQAIVTKTGRDVTDSSPVSILAADIAEALGGAGNEYTAGTGITIEGNVISATGGGTGGTGDAVTAADLAKLMPKVTASGVGQLVPVITTPTASYSVPAGGSWAYWRISTSDWSTLANASQTTGICAGGTLLATADNPTFGWAWRIA